MRYKLLVCLLILVTSCAFSQELAKTDQEHWKKETLTIDDYERLVKHFRYYKPDSATYFAQKGLALAQHRKDDHGVALMLIQLGMIADNGGKFKESEENYKRALSLFKKTGSQKGEATAIIRLGVVELRNGNYDKATDNFLQALNLAEASHDSFGIMEANYNISWAYQDQHNYDLSLHYLKIAEQINQQLSFSNISLNIYNNFGITYREKEEFQKAIYYLKKGIRLSNAVEYQGLNITLLINLATVYAKQGHKQQAIALQEKALLRSRAINNYLRELQSLAGLAKTYSSDDPAKAISYLQQAVTLARQKGVPKQEMRYLKEITKLYKSQGAYQNAFLMKEREHVLADSFYYNNMAQHIVTLKSEYELSRSKATVKELSFLNTKNQLELEKSTIIRNVIVAGLVLLLIILGLLFNQYKIKQVGNQLLEAKQIEINQKNKSLQQVLDEKDVLLVDKDVLLSEKEWMLKEIHHRVKNNLQVISSMLSAQSEFLEDPTALAALRESQNRVHAMALIHQKLYQSENLAQVNMQEYIHEIVDYLIDSFDRQDSVRQRLDISVAQLEITLATPVGLILNEVITNALKYAFPKHQAGLITVYFNVIDSQTYQLLISDNGVGFPAGFAVERSNTLGLSMILGLSKQIGGQLTIEHENGVYFNLRFSPVKRLAKPSWVAA